VKILVTGGGGYLGSEVCRLAVQRGFEVLATRLSTPAPHGRSLRLDVRDEAAVGRVFMRHGPQVVVHTAYRQTGPEMESAIVRGSHAVALHAHRCGARLVHLSSDLVFDGEAAPYREEDEPRPVSAYGAAKARAEELVRELHPEAVLVRTSVLYGKPEPGPQERLAASGGSFYTDEIRCPTVVSELAEALLELATLDVRGPLHVAAPDAVSRLELARLLGAVDPAGAPAPPGRPRDVSLDSSRAEELLRTRLRGVREVLK